MIGSGASYRAMGPSPQRLVLPVRRAVFWRAWLALAGIWISFLASTYVGGVPICLAGGAVFAVFTLTETGRWDDYAAALIAIAMVGILFISSVLSPMRLDRFEVLKGAVGDALFLLTIIFAPSALRRASAVVPLGLVALGMAIATAFFLEYFGLLSLKDLGLVSWGQNRWLASVFDARPSGLYGEPSWHSLAAASIGYFLTKSESLLAKAVAFVLAVSCVLSGSSTGLLLAALIGLRLTDLRSGKALSRVVTLWLTFIASVILYSLLNYFDIYESDQLQKIINPDKYGSGQSRFYLPLYYVSNILSEKPLFGMGLSYISEQLAGLTGSAVLPLNVFIESGIVGLIIYLVYFVRFFRIIGVRAADLTAFLICLATLGLQGSPFQAIMLVCYVTPWARPNLNRPRVSAARTNTRPAANLRANR